MSSQKTSKTSFFIFLRKTKKPLIAAFSGVAERMGFEPMNRFWRLHTFQACALDQLGHLSEGGVGLGVSVGVRVGVSVGVQM